jgi:hypothetical protein
VLVIEEKGRFKVKELVEVEMLKIVPVVPVETLVITELPKEIEVEVPIKTFWPPVIERPEPTVKSPKVVVPRPPEDTASGLVKVREVKLGVLDTAIVEVPVIAILVPAVKRLPMSE